jgi:hypothetical protein
MKISTERRIIMSKVMKLINPSTGLMECKVCGRQHIANLRGGGFYKRGSWQCTNGCVIEKEINTKGDIK